MLTVQAQELSSFLKLSINSLGPHLVPDYDMAGRQSSIFFEFENVLKRRKGHKQKMLFFYCVHIVLPACMSGYHVHA